MISQKRMENENKRCFRIVKKQCGKALVKWQDYLDKKEACERYLIQTHQMIDHMRENKIDVTDDFLKAAFQDVETLYKHSLENEKKYRELFLRLHLLVRVYKEILEQ